MLPEMDVNPYIRRAWYDTLAPNGYISPRVIFDYELLLVKDGKCRIQVADREYFPQKGDIFLFRPNREHRIDVASDAPLVQPHIHFDLVKRYDSEQVPINFTRFCDVPAEQRAWFRPDTLAAACPDITDFVRPSDGALFERKMVDVIYAHSNGGQLLNQLREKYLFMQLLHMVLYEMSLSSDRQHAQKKNTAAQIKTFLDHNNHHQITLDEIANKCFINKCYLITVFREAYGVTPHQYHRAQQIEESKYLLRFTNLSVTEIAETFGYGIHSFSNIFKKITGVSPSEYRDSVP